MKPRSVEEALRELSRSAEAAEGLAQAGPGSVELMREVIDGLEEMDPALAARARQALDTGEPVDDPRLLQELTSRLDGYAQLVGRASSTARGASSELAAAKAMLQQLATDPSQLQGLDPALVQALGTLSQGLQGVDIEGLLRQTSQLAAQVAAGASSPHEAQQAASQAQALSGQLAQLQQALSRVDADGVLAQLSQAGDGIGGKAAQAAQALQEQAALRSLDQARQEGGLEAAQGLAGQLVSDALDQGDLSEVVRVMEHLAMLEAGAGRLAEALVSRQHAALARARLGDTREARSRADDILARARELGSDVALARALLTHGEVAELAGELGLARLSYEQILARAPGQPDIARLAGRAALNIARTLGADERDRAVAAVDTALGVSAAVGDTYTYSRAAQARARIHAAAGERVAALRVLLTARAQLSQSDPEEAEKISHFAGGLGEEWGVEDFQQALDAATAGLTGAPAG